MENTAVQTTVNELHQKFNQLGDKYQHFYNIKLVIVGTQTEADNFSAVGIQYHADEPTNTCNSQHDSSHFMLCCKSDDFTFGWNVYKALVEEFGMQESAKADIEIIDSLLNANQLEQLQNSIKLVA